MLLGLNRLFSSTIVATIFAYSMDELDKYTELLTNEMAKNLIDVIDSPIIEEAIIQFPLLKESVDNYKKAVVDFYSEVQNEIDLARAYYEEYGFTCTKTIVN